MSKQIPLEEHLSLARRNPAHLESLAERMHERAYLRARKSDFPHEAAQDLAQDTRIQIINSFPEFRGATAKSFNSWVNRILIGKIAEYARKKRDVPFTEAGITGLDNVPAAESLPHEALEGKEATESVRAALEQLARTHPLGHQAITLVHLRGLSPLDAARQLRVPLNTLKARLFKGRMALRALMEEQA